MSSIEPRAVRGQAPFEKTTTADIGAVEGVLVPVFLFLVCSFVTVVSRLEGL